MADKAKNSHRKSVTAKQRKAIRAKTHGRCHICGGPLGEKWTVDHVIPHKRGGKCSEDNFLPACRICNGLRWHYDPKRIRRILRIGLYMYHEMRKETKLGLAVAERVRERKRRTKERRVKE